MDYNCLGQADFLVGQAIFHLSLAKINGQGTRQAVGQLNKKVNCKTGPGQAKLEWASWNSSLF